MADDDPTGRHRLARRHPVRAEPELVDDDVGGAHELGQLHGGDPGDPPVLDRAGGVEPAEHLVDDLAALEGGVGGRVQHHGPRAAAAAAPARPTRPGSTTTGSHVARGTSSSRSGVETYTGPSCSSNSCALLRARASSTRVYSGSVRPNGDSGSRSR